jgi:hypothetical protein
MNFLDIFEFPPIGFVGITGTRAGLSVYQYDTVFFILSHLTVLGGLKHGDAIGVDVQVANIATELGIPTFAYPPDNPKYRAFHQSTLIMEEKPYRVRDKDVANSDLLIACPKQSHEIIRSGTWATYRDAKKMGVSRILLLGES